MIIGFTGTQWGMTTRQKYVVTMILTRFVATKVHRGDRIGADDQFDSIARALNFYIVVHPSVNPKKQARVVDDDKTTYLTPKSYKNRDHDIVDACSLLVAAPKSSERLRSGTWSTVRYARKRRKSIIIVEP